MLSCNTDIKLTDENIASINRTIKVYRRTYESKIRKDYGTMAEDIIKVIKRVIAANRTAVTPSDFKMSEDTSKTQEQTQQSSSSFPGAISISDNPLVEYNGDRTAYARMERNFIRSIIEASIFKGETVVRPNANAGNGFRTTLNKNIWDLKNSLLNTILNYAKANIKIDVEGPLARFNAIQAVLSSFNTKNKSISDAEKETQEYIDALDAYVALANFDSFLKDLTPFVKVKAGMEEYEAKDRYEYVGASTKLDIISYKDDDYKANRIESNTSDLMSVLLEYFPEVDKGGIPIKGTTISQLGFSQAMTQFAKWLDTAKISDLLIGETNKKAILDTLENAYSGDIDALKRLFDTFTSKATSKSSVEFDRAKYDMNKLRGIQKVLDLDLPRDIKRMIWGLGLKTKPNIAKSVSKFNNSISGKLLQDNFRDRANQLIYDKVQGAIREFIDYQSESTDADNPQRYKILKDRYKIEVEDNKITVFKEQPNEVVLERIDNRNSQRWSIIKRGTNDDKVTINLLGDLLNVKVPANYQQILDQLSNKVNSIDLFDTFVTPICIAITAAEDSGALFWNDDDKKELALYRYNVDLTQLQTFLGIAYGTNVSSVLRNNAGNNVAGFQLTSMIRQMPKLAFKISRITDNAFKHNPIFRALTNESGRNMVGEPIVRVDVKIGDKVKAARDLTVSECLYLATMVDFYNNLKNDNYNFLDYQNTTFSDKNTHFLIPFGKDLSINGTLTLKKAVNDLLTAKSAKTRLAAQTAFMDAIFNCRQGVFTKVLDNIAKDYFEAFKGKSDSVWYNIDYNKLSNLDKLNKIKQTLDQYDNDIIQEAFDVKNLKFKEHVHASKGKFNETLENYLNLYVLSPDKTRFENRIKAQKELFVADLDQYDFTISRSVDPGNYKNLINDIGREWVDHISGDIINYKRDDEGNLILNPMLDAYFYSDILTSNSFNDLLFGHSLYHDNKYEIDESTDLNPDGTYNENYYIHSEASRLSASYKRTVIAGATVHSMLPSKYGIDSELTYAVIEDFPASVFNMMGVKDDDLDSMDGSGISSPIQAIFENISLGDAAVGMDKKTIFGDTDARFGAPTLLKWAVFADTNDRRQMSRGSTISLERVFEKMHSKIFDKDVTIEDYYIAEGESKLIKRDKIEGKVLSFTKTLYRFDVPSGKYYKIHGLKQNGRIATYYETEVDRKGNQVGPTKVEQKEVKNIYAIDQIFGGAYCMEYDNKTKQLEWSNANNMITANIVANEGLKKYMIGYLVNKSANKVGVTNINKKSSWIDNTPFRTTTMSLLFGGVQMNADHELEHSDVTEMSQMISALIQNGYFTNEVNEIYEEIGRVVTASLGKTIEKYKNNDYVGLHQELGKSLIRMFSTGSRDTLGLAQAYLAKAQKIFEQTGVVSDIPFSDPSVIGAFSSNLISNINKSGIRRRYAGIAAVLVPSRGMIQYYRLDDLTFTYNDLAKYLRSKGYNEDPNSYIHNWDYKDGVFNNPFIKKIENRRSIDIGDTIIKVNPDNTTEILVIDTWDAYYQARNGQDNAQYFNWTIKPKDLRQGNTTFDLNGENYSIYDLDSTAALHMTSKLKDVSLLSDQQRVFIQNSIGELINDNSDITTIRKKLIRRQNKDFKALDKGLDLGYNSIFKNYRHRNYLYKNTKFIPNAATSGDIFADIITHLNSGIKLGNLKAKFNIDNRVALALAYKEDGNLENAIIDGVALNLNPIELTTILKLVNPSINEQSILDYISTINITPTIATNIQTRFPEGMMGRLNAKQMGLRKDDSISEIKSKGSDFFKERMREDYKLPSSNAVNPNLYDAAIVGDTTLLVAIRSKHKLDDYKGFNVSNTFKTRNNTVVYNGEELCDINTKQFLSKSTEEGEVNLVIVDNIEELDDILDSNLFNDITYNYTVNNYRDLAKYTFDVDEDGFLQHPITLRDIDGHDVYKIKHTTKNGPKSIDQAFDIMSMSYSEEEIVEQLNQNEQNEINRRLESRAKQKYAAFLKQLQYIGARIPTQSMQSFMGLEIVGFSNSDVNEVYVPAIQTWLQGSDYITYWFSEFYNIVVTLINLVNCGELLRDTFTKL